MTRFAIGRGRTGALMLAAPAPLARVTTPPRRGEHRCAGGGACVVREYAVPATAGTLSVAGRNGGISVEGEARGDVRIVARISANAETDARAPEPAGPGQHHPP